MGSLLMMKIWLILTLVAAEQNSPAGETGGTVTDVLSGGENLADSRLSGLRTLDDVMSFRAPGSLEEWEKRKEELRRRILVSCGLWPVPEKEPVKAEVFDRKEFDGFAVEKVFLEVFPGYYATGNLYRPFPSDPDSKYPGVLCPHGHWPNGRFEDSEDSSVPGRCLSFARQGYVCFAYDMVGFGDHKKLFPEHRFGGDREALWGFHPAALQLRTSIRAVDFLESLPDVDPERIGCTGASGGGTQTFLLAAVDERIKVAAPVNMISSTMQGGCKCENPPNLRLETNNMEIGSMAAPRPMILISATGDWTAKTPEVEYPSIRSVYALYGAEDRIAQHQVDAGHNYNKESREEVYRWFGKWFYPGRSESDFEEQPFTVPPREDLSVFADREVPEDAKSPEDLFATWREGARERLTECLDTDPETFRAEFGQAWRMTMNVSEPEPGDITTRGEAETTVAGHRVEKFLICNEKTGQAVPANLWLPVETTSEATPVGLIHPSGKGSLIGSDGAPVEVLGSYLAEGFPAGSSRSSTPGRSVCGPVLTIDMFGTGEYPDVTERDEGINHFATYNLTDAACRIQDILLAESYLAKRFSVPPVIHGVEGAGAEVLLAHGLATRSARAIADLSDLDITGDRTFVERLNIPNIRLYGDFVTSIILGRERGAELIGRGDVVLETLLLKAVYSARDWRRQ
jgi:hypothetical protein